MGRNNMKQNEKIFIEQSLQSHSKWKEVGYPEKAIIEKEFHSGREVHVWRADTNVSWDIVSNLYQTLSLEERIKAEKFRFSLDQKRYIVSHAILRLILAAYVEEDPTELKFETTEYRKPKLVNRIGKNSIQFNMSHSENVVCYSMSSIHDVGIDIEYVNSNFEWYDLARAYCTPMELSLLESVPKRDQHRTFFSIWTRKEALLKAIGIGLSGIGETLKNEFYLANSNYTLIPFKCWENYEGTVAVRAKISKVHFFHFLYEPFAKLDFEPKEK
jgi:4'-phosphopantetheinyl transferase